MSRALTSQTYAAVRDLLTINPWAGVRLTLFNIVVINALLAAILCLPNTSATWPVFIALALVAGFFYSFAMMSTHDAIHHTLTGWYWFDEVVPRLFAYFIFWPHGLYAELHKLHHKLNGKDLQDPERPTYTVQEYATAGAWRRALMRHDWWLSLFVYAGFGMIYRHLRHGFRLWHSHVEVRRAMCIDALGIACCATVEIWIVAQLGAFERFGLYLLCLERIIGFFHQLRSHIEHYGLFGTHENLISTRLYNCRNVHTSRLVSRFFNGLNFHSVHHAFPGIPFYHLQLAHERVARVCAQAGRPLTEGKGYAATVWELARQPVFLELDKQRTYRPQKIYAERERVN